MIYLALEDAKGDGAINLIAKQQNKWWQCYAPVGIALRLPERSRESATMLCTPLAHFCSHEPHSNNTSPLLNHISLPKNTRDREYFFAICRGRLKTDPHIQDTIC